jgi:hypothetical protein
LAGAAAALAATALHEIVGFGLQTPVNRYLLAAWVGLVWGVWARVEEGKRRSQAQGADDPPDMASGEKPQEDLIGDGNVNDMRGEG